jgi:hypothetical protein
MIVDSVTAAADGTFADHPIPDAAGTWQVVASYAGDASDLATSSQACQFTVSLEQTALTLSCPDKSALGMALAIGGNITPPIDGASITLTYTHQTQGPLQTFTSIVTTDSSGAFSDATIKPGDAGAWDVSAAYAGDPARSPSSSQPCAIAVS